MNKYWRLSLVASVSFLGIDVVCVHGRRAELRIADDVADLVDEGSERR
jgi:hypothetical protein